MEAFVGCIKKSFVAFGHDGYIAVPQRKFFTLLVKLEGQTGSFYPCPGTGLFLEDGKDAGEVLEDFHFFPRLGVVKKLSNDKIEATHSAGIHENVNLPKGAFFLAEVVLPDGGIDEHGAKRTSFFLGIHRSNLGHFLPSPMAGHAFKDFHLLPFYSFLHCHYDCLRLVFHGCDF